MSSAMTAVSTSRFARYAWVVLAYNILVILWGAFVRATGSGAGCGSHWPLCNGDVVPRAPDVATVIEFTHRLTSGLALVAVVVLAVWAFRIYPRGHRVRRAASWSLIIILIEALLGAGIVLLEYVEANQSWGRAAYLCAHLTNTLLLVSALALTAWLPRMGTEKRFWPLSGRFKAAFGVLLLSCVTGAIAALGDTVFPATSLTEGMRSEFAAEAPALLRLRLVHPVVAVGAAVYLFCVGFWLRRTAVSAQWVLVLTVTQTLAGAVNVVLLAPVWMQLLHLFLATLLWLSLLRLSLQSSR